MEQSFEDYLKRDDEELAQVWCHLASGFWIPNERPTVWIPNNVFYHSASSLPPDYDSYLLESSADRLCGAWLMPRLSFFHDQETAIEISLSDADKLGIAPKNILPPTVTWNVLSNPLEMKTEQALTLAGILRRLADPALHEKNSDGTVYLSGVPKIQYERYYKLADALFQHTYKVASDMQTGSDYRLYSNHFTFDGLKDSTIWIVSKDVEILKTAAAPPPLVAAVMASRQAAPVMS